MGLIALLTFISIVVIAWVFFFVRIRPKVRNERLRRLEEDFQRTVASIETAHPQFDYSVLQKELGKELTRIEATMRTLPHIEQRAKSLPIPLLAEPTAGESSNAVIDRMAKLFDGDSIFVLGAEQVIYRLMDLSGPALVEQISFAKEALDHHMSLAGLAASNDLHRVGADIIHDFKPDLHNLLENLHQYYIHQPMAAMQLFGRVLSVVKDHNSAGSWLGLAQHLSDSDHLALAQHAFGHTITSVSDHLGHATHSIGEHAHAATHTIFDHASNISPVEHIGVDFHFPFITLLLSAKREIKLLTNDKTSIDKALKNALLDVSGTGIGGFAGAKVGAVIGSFIAPGVGIVVGGILGAIGGAIGGRLVTKRIKMEPLYNAIDEYNLTFRNMEVETTAAAHRAASNVRSVSLTEKDSFYHRLGNLPNVQTYIQSSRLTAATEELRSDIQADIKIVRAELDTAIKQASAIEIDEWYHHILGISVGKSFRAFMQKTYNQKDARLKVIENAIPKGNLPRQQPLECLKQICAISPKLYGKYAESFRRAKEELHNILTSYSLDVMIWSTNAANCYRNSMGIIASSLQTEAELFNFTCKNWKEKVERTQTEVKRQQEALGLC